MARHARHRREKHYSRLYRLAGGLSTLVFVFSLVIAILPQVPLSAAAQQETFRHWLNDNGNWATGAINAQNSTYAEGDVIPHWIEWSNATVGSSATFSFSYEWQDASSNTGHDYLDDVNETETATLVGGLSSIAIPADPEVVSQLGAQPSGQFLFKGFTVDSVILQTFDHGDREDKYYTLTVTFTETTAHLYYGAHLARDSQWPAGGASSFSGGNLENRFDRDGIGIGSQADQTRSIQVGAIGPEPSSSIVVEKVSVGGVGTFGFSSGSLSPSVFELATVAENSVVGRTFSELAAGTYDVTETLSAAQLAAGWSLTSAVCDDQSPPSAISLQAGETVTCTFTNTLPPPPSSIVVEKVSVGGVGTFGFSSGSLSPSVFELATVAENSVVGRTFSELAAGTYDVTETLSAAQLAAGWSLTSAVCDDQSPPSAISLQAGETVTCTFTNTLPPPPSSIVVEKVSVGGVGTFGFSSGSLSPSVFELATVAENSVVGRTFSELAAGTYDVTETLSAAQLAAGWSLTSAVCDDQSPPSAISLQAGETVTCTFTNTLPPPPSSIVVEKVSVGGVGTFGFSSGSLSPSVFELATVAENSVVGRTFSELAAGTYDVTETLSAAQLAAGWSLTSAVCDDQSPPSAISLQAGETVTCTFTNTLPPPPSSIVVEKVSVGGVGTFGFSSGSLSPSVFELATVAENSVVGRTFSELAAGTYDVTETLSAAQLAAGWSLTSAVCDDQSPPSAISLQAGETVTCTFTNTLPPPPSSIVVEKVSVGGVGTFGFSSGSLSPSVFELATVAENSVVGRTFSELAAGTYDVTETLSAAQLAAGWSLTSAVCDDQSPPSAISLQAGETVTCTFTNRLSTTTTTTTTVQSLGSIGDFVWDDGVITEGNGFQDTGDVGVGGVMVNLYDGSGTVKLASQVTGSDGKYLFAGLPAGSYLVEFVIPAGSGFIFVSGHPGGPDAADSDADPVSGRSGVITLSAGQNDLSWDAGLTKPAVLPQVITTTTSPPPETLPFTGLGEGDLGGVGVALLVLGSVLLLVMHKREEETEAISGWSTRL